MSFFIASRLLIKIFNWVAKVNIQTTYAKKMSDILMTLNII